MYRKWTDEEINYLRRNSNIKNAQEIANILGRSHKAIIMKSNKLRIRIVNPQRNNIRCKICNDEFYIKSFAAHLRIHDITLLEYCYEYPNSVPKYMNKEWLINEYRNKSTIMIAKEQKVTDSTISRWIKNFGMKTGLHLHNHMILNQQLLEYLNGELLGDGNLNPINGKNGITSVRYQHGSSRKGYIEWLIRKLNELGMEQSGKINISIHRPPSAKRLCTTYGYSSKSYVELKKLYMKWYPKGKKIIPRDLKLTPIIVRQWYIGDGYYSKGKSSLAFATCAFIKKNLDILVYKLKELGINCYIRKDRVCINADSFFNFFEYIGECPEEIKDIYGYKWPTEDEYEKLKRLKIKSEFANDTYRNKDWLINQYINGLKSTKEIENEFGINSSIISKWLKKFKISARSISESKKLYHLKRGEL